MFGILRARSVKGDGAGSDSGASNDASAAEAGSEHGSGNEAGSEDAGNSVQDSTGDGDTGSAESGDSGSPVGLGPAPVDLGPTRMWPGEPIPTSSTSRAAILVGSRWCPASTLGALEVESRPSDELFATWVEVGRRADDQDPQRLKVGRAPHWG